MSLRFITCHYTVYMSPGAEASILLEPPRWCTPTPIWRLQVQRAMDYVDQALGGLHAISY